MATRAQPPCLVAVAVLLLLASGTEALAARSKRAGGGGGFGQQPQKKKSAATVAKKATTLDAKVLREHAANCAAAKQTFGTCADDTDGAYRAGWEPHRAPADAVSPGNEPYGTRNLLLRSAGPLLSTDECASLVDEMEAHGAACGWDQRYPLAGYTREVKVSDMPGALVLLKRALSSTLLPAAAEAFGFASSSLRVNEALVVKYDAASGHNALPVHCDFSLLTLNVALSPPEVSARRRRRRRR
eukprot:6899091-Prymnesium_polylepis.1